MAWRHKKRQLWKSGLYRSLFFSYVIVLLVPILISPLILYGAGDAVTRQVDNANETSLTLLQNAIDAQLSEIYTASSYLLIHEAAWRMKQKNCFTTADTADLHLLQDALKQSISKSPIIADIYLCFPQADAVLSRQNLTYGRGFTFTAQTALGMELERWESELHFTGRRKYCIIGSDKEPARQHLLIYHQYNQVTSEKVSPMVVVTSVNLDMLRGVLSDYGQGGAAVFSIEDDAGAVISVAADTAQPKRETLMDRLFYHGLKARTAESAVLKWRYRLTPEADAAALGMGMPSALAVYYGICLLLGFLLVAFFSRSHYTPVQRLTGTLLSSMRRTQPGSGTAQNEYAFLEVELTRMLQELRDSDRQINEMQNLRKEKLLHDMARGRVDDRMDKRLEEFGLGDQQCPFLLAVYSVNRVDLHLSHLPDEDSGDDVSSLDLIDLIISRVAGSFQPEGCTTHFFPIDNSIVCLLLEKEPLESKTVEAAAAGALKYLHDRLGIIAAVAISGTHEALSEMPEAYREAVETLGSMMLKGQELQVGCFDNLPKSIGMSDQDGLSGQTVFQQQLVMLEKAQQYEQMEQCFLRETERAFSNPSRWSRRQLELLLTRYVGILWQILADISENCAEKHSVEGKLLECSDIIALKSCTQEVFRLLKQEKGFKIGEGTSERDWQIVGYIQEHYTDCDLNINALSDYFHLTPSYLSKIVRRCVGTTALDYIQNLRIAKARELISQTDKSLQEIAEEVGYGNKLNIIRAFKRSEGVTPSVYREQNFLGRTKR